MIRVCVPATSANLGPGYDCMGLSLGMHNIIEVELAESGIEIEQCGIYNKQIPPDKNLVYKAMLKVFEASKVTPPGIRIRIETHIPPTRGLGSSAACIVGGMVAANALYGRLGPREILSLACKMEGHPDNAVPCLTGGLVTAYYDGRSLSYNRIKMPEDIKLALVYPDTALSTFKSRMSIPKAVTHKDAAFNAAHSAMFVSAIATGRYSLLREAMRDRLHQPYRKPLISHMDDIFEMFYSAGAYGCYLSGSGPTIGAVIPAKKEKQIQEKAINWLSENENYRFEIYGFDNEGTHVSKL